MPNLFGERLGICFGMVDGRHAALSLQLVRSMGKSDDSADVSHHCLDSLGLR